jgi:ribosomal protein S18 acetylase RimI-like enzyme
MSEDRHALLVKASQPRRATEADAVTLAQLLAAAFQSDPVMDYIARRGPKRAEGLRQFFYWLLTIRALPYGETWMSDDASACSVWLPPNTPSSPGGLFEQLKLLPMFLRLCGLARFGRGSAMGDAMEKNHPHDPHYYLAFVAVAPRLQGLGLGGTILESTIKRIDEAKAAAYLENSNPKNTRFYERLGFVARKNISPPGAPPLIAMWRSARAL